PFDPGDDGDAELVAAGPALAVEDVALQGREERFHGRVVARRADLAHGADQGLAGQGPLHLPSAELAASIAVEHTSGDVTVAAGDGHLDGGDHEASFHPRGEGPTDDPVRVQVLDRAAVELPLGGG